MSVTNRQIDTNNIREIPQLLREMRFTAMAKRLEEQLDNPATNIYAVASEVIDLVLAEYNSRCTNKINKFIKKANLKIPGADFEDLYEECILINQFRYC